MPRRPSKLIVEPIRARVRRGPDAAGRWYWRAVVYQGQKGGERTVLSGWFHREDLARRLAELVAEGLSLDGTADQADEVETVRDLLEVWVAATLARPRVSGGYKAVARNSGRLLVRELGDVRLSRLDAGALEGFRDARLREASPGTVKRDLKVLRSAWAWGRRRGLVDGELADARVKVTPARDKRTPSPDEVIRVLEALEGKASGWPRMLTLLLFATGGRLTEIASLTWQDVELEAGRLYVRQTKAGQPRVVPLHADVVAELESWRRPTDRDASRVLRVAVSNAQAKYGTRFLAPACEAAGVPRFTPHGLRRAAVDRLQRSGVDVGAAAKLLGHSPAVMLQHYRQATAEDLERAVQQASLGSLSGEGKVMPLRRSG